MSFVTFGIAPCIKPDALAPADVGANESAAAEGANRPRHANPNSRIDGLGLRFALLLRIVPFVPRLDKGDGASAAPPLIRPLDADAGPFALVGADPVEHGLGRVQHDLQVPPE